MPKQRRFDGQPPSASAMIDGNDDLLKEILRRLPAKSLLRFSCVSKRWLSLITDPHFSLLWSKPKSDTIPGLFLRRLSHPSGTPILDYVPLNSVQYHHEDLPFNPLDSGIKSVEEDGIDVLQSCNGLLLCSSYRLRHHSGNFYVYNPTTNKYRSLPPPIGFGEKIVRGVNLAFEPSKSHHYRVVCVSSYSSLLRGIYLIQIYSSETHTWRASDDILVGPFDVAFENGIFWNGSINWVSRESDTFLSFNVYSETSNNFPMPPSMEGEKERIIAFINVSSTDNLHIGLISAGGSQLDIFTMEKDFSKWVVKYHVDLEATLKELLHMPVPLPFVYWKFSVLGFLWDEHKEESCLMIYVPGKLGCYKIEEKCLKNVCELNTSSNEEYWSISPNCKWVAAYPYIQSLCCV